MDKTIQRMGEWKMGCRNMKWEQVRKRENNIKKKQHTYTIRTNPYESTEKQREYAKHLVSMCDELGIDLSFANPQFHSNRACHRIIQVAHTMLKKNGYDAHGNKIKETEAEQC